MEIKLCGVGGQGMGVAGRLLGEAAIFAGLHVVQTTAYGVESRGGTSTSDVILQKESIYFPEVRRPDAILIMAEKGLEANVKNSRPDTLILYDSGTVHVEIPGPGKKHPFPFLDRALKKFSSSGAATIVGLGTLVEMTAAVPFETLEEAIKRCLPPKVQEQNLEALRMGRELAKGA